VNDRYVFGLIDPRDHRIFHVGTLARGVELKEHVADSVADAKAGKPGPTNDHVRAILAADYDTPHAVILQAEASAADEVAWIKTLEAAGNRLTNP